MENLPSSYMEVHKGALLMLWGMSAVGTDTCTYTTHTCEKYSSYGTEDVTIDV